MFVPFMYGVLTYIGVNGYIIIFTVLYMGAELFQACDIPWRFYFYSASGCIGVGILGGAYTMRIYIPVTFSVPGCSDRPRWPGQFHPRRTA